MRLLVVFVGGAIGWLGNRARHERLCADRPNAELVPDS